jgi:hypothetical protein
VAAQSLFTGILTQSRLRPRADAGSRIGTPMEEAAYSGPPISPGRSGDATIDPRGIGLWVSSVST